jgi:mono/diheme cytochrome c family protein
MRVSLLLLSLCTLAACVQDMGIDGHLLPSDSIDKKPQARRLPEHVIARGQLDQNDHKAPVSLSKATLERGQERYDIFCAPCHGLSGSSNGVIVKRGFLAPPTFHQERLRRAPAEHFVDVIRDGFGAMHGYSDLISKKDAFAIVNYIRALQLSQNAQLKSLPESLREQILRVIE